MKIELSNEINLVQQTLNGDTSAFDRLVKIHRTTIYALVLSYIKNPADAEDLTQRIFIRAYERLATLRELDRFRPWLQQIAHNTCKDWLRRRNDSTTCFEATNHIDFAEVAPSPEDIVLKAEIETVVQQAISTLQETDRRLMEARYVEGVSYDQLQVESGLSYAAVANRLKRAKREIRYQIEKLLGGVAILPDKMFILGGIEAVKLSAKAKLAAVGVAAVIGIGGGGVVYHHTFESNPIAINEQAISAANAVTGNSSTKVVHREDTVSGNSFPMNGTSMLEKGGANRSEVSTDSGVVNIKDIRKLSKGDLRELPAEVLQLIIEALENHSGKPMTWTFEDRLGKSIFIEKGREQEIASSELIIPRPLTEEELKQKIASGELTQVKIEDESGDGKVILSMPKFTQLTDEELEQKIASGELIRLPTAEPSPSTPTESQPNSAHSALTPSDPSVESVTTRPEIISEVPTQFSSDDEWAAFEELLSEFSDDEWAELERLLRTASGGETLQREEQAPLDPKQQQQTEKVLEETPVDPSMRQEIQHQRRLPLENDTHALPPKTDRNMGR